MCQNCSKELAKTYDPKGIEGRLYKKWEDNGYFHAEVDRSKKPFTIVMPPPNITGQLHMGHALDNTMQDILIRYKRMQGYNALWQPGTDHASIATEVKVIENLKKQGIDKHDLGREGFLEKCYEWKDEYGSRIINQLKKMGSSADWQRERFTMDKGCSDAVLEVFVKLYEKGLIYKGSRIVNWCPVCNRRKRQPFNLPLENLLNNRRGFLIKDHIAVFFIPAITIREIALLELSAFHLCLERGRNLAGDVLRVECIDHVLQRDNEAFAGAVRIKVVVVLFDGDKPKPDLRKDPFQIGSSLDVVTPEPAEITNYKALDPAGADVVHQPVELRSIKNRSCSSVVHIGIYQIQVGTLCNVRLANLNLICDDIHLFGFAAVFNGKTGIDGC